MVSLIILNFKDKKPPKNESLQTYNELKSLQKLPQDIQFVKDKDEISEVFERVCERYGVKYPKKWLKNYYLIHLVLF